MNWLGKTYKSNVLKNQNSFFRFNPLGNNGFRFPFLFRRRREADISNSLDPLVEELFQRVLESDDSGCGLRFVCDLGRRNTNDLPTHASNLQTVLT